MPDDLQALFRSEMAQGRKVGLSGPPFPTKPALSGFFVGNMPDDLQALRQRRRDREDSQRINWHKVKI